MCDKYSASLVTVRLLRTWLLRSLCGAVGDNYRASAHPDPKNEAERAANRQAADDYQRQEEEGADFLDWERELEWR
ncbi:hypothetical protein ACH4YN_33400 [Streptomyces griseofuscus]|uniref:hypothetical protein n=1 Tax=Streptomyces griseofuscus TaxID=146922 RepID=UPI0037ABE03C